MDACGNHRTATFLTRPLALATSNSRTHGLATSGLFVDPIFGSIGLGAIGASYTAERVESGARASGTQRGAFPRTSVSRNLGISGSSYESLDSEASRIEVAPSVTGGTSGP